MKDGILIAVAIGALFFLLEEGKRKRECGCKKIDLGDSFAKATGATLVLELPDTK